MSSSRLKIVSGGQTGVDRGALDAALQAGTPCGGWCPKGRRAEDGPIAARYPLSETDSPRYIDRTRQNVIDSDGTLIIYFGELEGGTARTREFCLQQGKPYLLVDADDATQEASVEKIRDFVREYGIRTLNVAGPRASKVEHAHRTTQGILSAVIEALEPAP